MFGLTQKRQRFFELFDELSGVVAEAGTKLAELLERFDLPRNRAGEIRDLRRRGEATALEARKDLGGTFVTPLDREDIEGLVGHFEGLLGRIEATADQIALFKIETPTVEARELAEQVKESAALLARAMKLLATTKAGEILGMAIEVRELTSESDRLQRRARASLFESRRDPVHLMKWSEIYDELEAAAAHAAGASRVLETIVRKHA